MKRFDAVIIGAGSVGVILSYFLACKGLKLAVIEQRPSYCRGQHKAAIGGVRATHSEPAKIQVGQRSLDFFRSLKPQFGFDVDYVEGGYLFPAYDQQIANSLKQLLSKQKQNNLDIDWVDKSTVMEIVPGICSEGLLGGTFSPQDGHLSPLKLANAYYRLAVGKGVEFFFRTKVIDVAITNGLVTTIKTTNNSFSSEYVINAAGAFARDIGLMMGTELAVYPDSHEAGVTEPVKHFVKPMIVDIQPSNNSDNYYFYQDMEGSIVFCITPRPKRAGTDTRSTSEFLPMVIRRMLNLYPRLKNLKVRRIWRGLYPATPDQSPLVGFDRNIANVFHVVGMSGQGLMLGPGLSEIVADLLVDHSKEDQEIFDHLSPYRSFIGGELLQ